MTEAGQYHLSVLKLMTIIACSNDVQSLNFKTQLSLLHFL